MPTRAVAAAAVNGQLWRRQSAGPQEPTLALRASLVGFVVVYPLSLSSLSALQSPLALPPKNLT